MGGGKSVGTGGAGRCFAHSLIDRAVIASPTHRNSMAPPLQA
jgi:hypothetical protein